MRVLPERDELHASQVSDPVERLIEQALVAGGVRFRRGAATGELDYYLIDLDIWIECKRAYTPRVSRQLERHERVILVQSLEAAEVLAGWISGAR